MASDRMPYAFIGHDGKLWMGVMSADMPRDELVPAIARWITNGISIIVTYTHDEFIAELNKLDA